MLSRRKRRTVIDWRGSPGGLSGAGKLGRRSDQEGRPRRGDQMRRRQFLALIGGAALVNPVYVLAQSSGRPRTIGILMGSAATPPIIAGYNAFVRRLSDLGWIEGKNFRAEIRWANSNPQLMQDYARELVGIGPDVILAMSNPALGALRPVAADVPIVFANVADPVNTG